jgi:hypothetical protein
MRRVQILLAAAVAASTVALSAGQRGPAPPADASFVHPFRSIASPAAPGSAQPNLTTDADGRVWLSWLEPRATGGGHAFRASTLIGANWSAPITIAEGTNLLANWADFPSLFVATDGTMAAHWLERAPAGRYAYFVRLRTSRDGGRTWSPMQTPHQDESATEHGFVSFFDAPGGGVGLVWLDGRQMSGGHTAGHGSMSLRSTLIRRGEPGDDVAVDSRVCECCQTSAARAGDAVLVVYRDRSDKEIRDTSVVRLVDGEWSEPATVHADGWEITSCPVNGPVVAASGNAAAVAWFTGAGGAPKTFAAFSSDAGRTFGDPVRVDAATTLGRLAMVMAAPNRAIVLSLERGSSGGRLVLRDVRPSGSSGEPYEFTPTTLERAGGVPRLVRSGRTLFVAWTQVRQGQPTLVNVGSMDLK